MASFSAYTVAVRFLADNISLVAKLAAVGVLGYYIALTLYNAFLHPLSKFPGPKWRSTLQIFDRLDEVLGSQVENTRIMHEKYGPVVRISPDSLSFNTSQAWRDIYQVKPGTNEIQKDMHFFTQNTSNTPSILVSNTSDHARIRKLTINGFSDRALRSQEPIMIEYINKLITKLKALVDGPLEGKLDLKSWYIFTTFDTIADLCFNESFGALESGHYHPWMISVLDGIKNGRFVRLQRAYPLIAWFVQRLRVLWTGETHLNIARERHLQYTSRKTKQRLANTEERDDITTQILKKNSSQGMSEAEIGQTLVLLTTAGSEPTAAGLSGVTFLLLKNPDKLTQLVKEIRQAFNNPIEITSVTTQSLPYLNAVIEEGLRLYPPVPSRFPRRTEVDNIVIDGHVIPKNTSVGVAQYATYQSKRNFARPNEFLPERWLPNASSEFDHDDKASLQPFSTGPRNCIGKNYAYLQMRQILCRLLWEFDVELSPESAHWSQQKAYLLWDMPALHVKLSQRQQINYRVGTEVETLYTQ